MGGNGAGRDDAVEVLLWGGINDSQKHIIDLANDDVSALAFRKHI